MKQKQLIFAVVAIVVVILIFVGYRQWGMNTVTENTYLDLENSLLESPVQKGGKTYLVPPTHIVDSGADLPALSNPVFTTVSDADTYLSDAVTGISIEVNGQQRFYSYQILNWHEVVNETIDGQNLAVTYCTLCHSPAVYTSDSALSHAGKIYNNNELLVDENSSSYWNQMTGQAIVGERAGDVLERYPYETMTWGDWKELYPSGSVLSNETGYERDYGRHPFENYDIADIYFFPLNTVDERVSGKWLVDGAVINDSAVAFSRNIMRGTWVLNFDVEENDYVAFYDVELGKTYVYEAQGYTFTYDQERDEFIDQNGGAWTAQGRAVSGDATGAQLTEVPTQEAFYMCWYANHTNTLVSYIDLMDKTNEEALDDTTDAQE